MKKTLLRMLFMIIAISISNLSFGQGSTSGSITGVVIDEENQGLPGATVVAIHGPSGTEYGQATRIDGRYSFPSVRVGGPYTIKVSFVGYPTEVRTDVYVSLGQSTNLNFNLKASAAELQEVVIKAERYSMIDSDKTGASTGISNQTLTNLPTINRSLSDYTRLTPQAGGGGFGGINPRFNNLTVDGSIFNNSFGLSSTIGGQTGAEPISLDAIDQVNVSISPYDVTIGTFTGANISAITRSGTNEIEASVYGFVRTPAMIGSKIGEFVDESENDFSYYQSGFRVGGPLIKDKLFFFLNAEVERQIDPGTNFRARQGNEPIEGNVSRAREADLNQLRSFLIENYDYNPGPYQGYDLNSNSERITARIDWNISKKHKAIFRYNQMNSFRDNFPSSSGSLGSRNPSQNALPFRAQYYQQYNNLNSFVAELVSNLSPKMNNKLIIGYNRLRDFRESEGGIFPTVDIIDPETENTVTSFGFDSFSPNNVLSSDVVQLSNNLTYFADKHTLTFGTHNEFYSFENGFLPFSYGYFRFNSFDDFYESATNGVSNAAQYRLAYSSQGRGIAPVVNWSAMQLGFYIQDEFAATRDLKLTAGLRVDIPIYLNAGLLRNESMENLVFNDGNTYRTDQFPGTQILWSPRIGFNWDVNGNGSTQIRGGSGLFAGRPPFVWVSNQASNNGILSGTEFSANPTDRPFNPNVEAYVPTNALTAPPGNYNLALLAKDFKFPQVWRTNLGVDQKLGQGFFATLEAIYTRDVNSVIFRNINLPEAAGRLEGADNRPYWDAQRIHGNITDAILLDNVSSGYRLSLTAQLQKTFDFGLNIGAAYTYSDAREQFGANSSVANSNWRAQFFIEDVNNPEVGFAQFNQRHRIIANASHKFEYFNNFGTTLSFFYEAGPAGNVSWTIGNSDNMVATGTGGNSALIYIPTESDFTSGQFIINDVTDFSAQQQWDALNSFIESDRYLSRNRGGYAERFSGELPWASAFDFRVLQDFYFTVGGKRNTLQLSVDIFNMGNFINPFLGVRQQFIALNPYAFQGFVDDTKMPTYTVNANIIDDITNLRDNLGTGSRWRMQVGLRYIF